MRADVRIPGDFQVPTRFFGTFSAKDLVRITAPSLPGATIAYQHPTKNSLLLFLAGLLFGVLWYGWKPYNQHLDVLGYNLGRWLSAQHFYENDSVEEHEDHLVLEDGSTIALIEVSPTSLEMKTRAEQRALHATYKKLFETVSYPIHIHSIQSRYDLSGHVKHIEQMNPSTDSLTEEYVDFCENFSENRLSSTRHIIALKVDRDNLHWLENRIIDQLPTELKQKIPFNTEKQSEQEALTNELDSRCKEVLEAVDSADLTAEQITGTELHSLSTYFETLCTHPGVNYNSRPKEGSGAYRKTIYISELPSSIEIGWPVQLLRVEGLVDVTQVVEPKNVAKSTKKLQRLSEKLNAEIDSFLRQGYRGTNKLEGLLEDVEWFLNLLADRKDQPVEHGIYITAHANSQETCRETFKQVCNRLQTMQIDFKQPVFRTDQAARTDSPLHSDWLDEKMLVPGQSAAAGFPFATQNLEQQEGVIHGVDTGEETPVLMDRFSWPSHSMARMGMVGSGKSYAAKLEILRSHLSYPDLQIIIVDPKREYSQIINSLGGTVQNLNAGNHRFDDKIISFQVEKRGQEENVRKLVDLVQEIYDYCSQTTDRTLVLIDEARILMNNDSGKRILNDFVLEARDTNTAITLISQNASHFTYCREGREILDNMPGKVFMRHDRVPNSVVDYFDLSQQEKQKLFELKTGTDSDYSEALLKVSNRFDSRIRIESTSQEHTIIQSGDGQP